MGGRPLAEVEWHSLHDPAVLEFQIDVPTWAAELRPLLWHETPEQVSSLPVDGFITYVPIEADAFVTTVALLYELG